MILVTYAKHINQILLWSFLCYYKSLNVFTDRVHRSGVLSCRPKSARWVEIILTILLQCIVRIIPTHPVEASSHIVPFVNCCLWFDFYKLYKMRLQSFEVFYIMHIVQFFKKVGELISSPEAQLIMYSPFVDYYVDKLAHHVQLKMWVKQKCPIRWRRWFYKYSIVDFSLNKAKKIGRNA